MDENKMRVMVDREAARTETPEDCVSRLARMVMDRTERDRAAGVVYVPRPTGLFAIRDVDNDGSASHPYDDYPEMSQDDWRDQLNPNEGCK